MPGGGILATVRYTASDTYQEGRAERTGGKGGLQRRAEVGQIQRRREATQDGAYTARGTLSVPHAEFPAGADEELRCVEEGTGMSRVFGANLQGSDVAQETGCERAYT